MQPQEQLERAINRILVVLDDDLEGREGLMTYALGLSRLFGASLLLVCPVELPVPLLQGPTSQGPPVVMLSGIWEGQRVEAQEMVDEALAECRKLGVGAEGKVVMGVSGAKSALTSWASQCDLVVVSRRKKRGLEALFRGDTALEMVKSSVSPVMVVEPRPVTTQPTRGRLRPGEAG